MTERIRAILPGAHVRAVEPDPAFADRLQARLGHDPQVELVRRSILDLPLEADLIVAAEVLYYVASAVGDVVHRLRARHLLTSSHGAFDEHLAELLHDAGFRELATRRLSMRFERAGGEHAPFLVRRVGAMVRLWDRAPGG